MRTSQDAKRLSLENIDSLFANQKSEEQRKKDEKKKFDALPTIGYYFTIMSDDRDLLEEEDEDPCQKYSQRGWGKTQELAKEDSISRFKEQWGSDLEIYWIKCNGIID
jgi:hypothetical protein